MYSVCLLTDPTNADQLVYRSSTRRLERKLDKLVAEIRAGKRQGSVVSIQTLESLSTDEKSLWRELRHEMEDVGISTAVIMDRKEFIIEWLKTAIAEGGLDEVGELSDDENVESERPPPSLGSPNHRQTTLATGSDITARSPSPFEKATAQFPASPIEAVAATYRNGARTAPQPSVRSFSYSRKGSSDLTSIRGLFRGLSRALRLTGELEKTSEGGDASAVGLNLLHTPEENHEIE